MTGDSQGKGGKRHAKAKFWYKSPGRHVSHVNACSLSHTAQDKRPYVRFLCPADT